MLNMAFKTITLSLEAYGALKRIQKPGESFSQETLRLASAAKPSLDDVIGIFTDEEAEIMRKNIGEMRRNAKVRTWQ